MSTWACVRIDRAAARSIWWRPHSPSPRILVTPVPDHFPDTRKDARSVRCISVPLLVRVAGILSSHCCLCSGVCVLVPVQQVQDDLSYLSKHGVKIDEFWLDVERSDWGSNHTWNTHFIWKMADEAKKHTKAKVGVYTSESQWTPITGGSDRMKEYPLWWATYDGTPGFSGFRHFGGWEKPYMHQFVCAGGYLQQCCHTRGDSHACACLFVLVRRFQVRGFSRSVWRGCGCQLEGVVAVYAVDVAMMPSC